MTFLPDHLPEDAAELTVQPTFSIGQGLLRTEVTSGGHRRFDERDIIEVLRKRKNLASAP